VASNWADLLAAKTRIQPIKEIRLRNGMILRAPDNVDLGFLFHEIWIRHVYSPVGYGIRDGDVVIDIGANIGVFAAFVLSCGSRVQLVAYEPNQQCLPWLLGNAGGPDHAGITVHGKAVGGSRGTRRLTARDNWLLPALAAAECGEGDPVECVTLEDVLAENHLAGCDLLKLDCEGSEYEILLSCSEETLAGVRRVVAEYHAFATGNGASLGRHLERHGFRIDRFVATGEKEGYLCASRR
jgi:FkbM family methyltransferase